MIIVLCILYFVCDFLLYVSNAQCGKKKIYAKENAQQQYERCELLKIAENDSHRKETKRLIETHSSYQKTLE